jgi:hypothetical protein
MCESPLERGGGVCFTYGEERWQTHPCHCSARRAPSQEGIGKISAIQPVTEEEMAQIA